LTILHFRAALSGERDAIANILCSESALYFASPGVRVKIRRMLKAYFDEGNDDKVFLMGGWLADVAEWERFSQAWTTELKASPSIEYFKNNEAMGLKDQFAGWAEKCRDEKVLAFARIIAGHELVGFVGGVGFAKFKNLFGGSILPKKTLRSIVKYTEPYHFACLGVISVTLGYQVLEAKNRSDQVDFIFDEGVRFLDDCVANYPRLKSVLPPEAGAIAGAVNSENDRRTPELQAADMLVGQALLNLRIGRNTGPLDVLTTRKINQFDCLPSNLASIPKSMARMNDIWSTKQPSQAKRKAEPDKIHKTRK
jgi:hypothetical protein